MVGIRYTGLDGRTTEFRSKTADGALGRLGKIPGYAKGGADEVAARLAGGWRERHKERAAAIAKRRQPFFGRPSGAKYASPSGLVSGLPHVTDVRIEHGKIVATSQKSFVSDGGQTVGVGPRRTEIVGAVPAESKDGGGAADIGGKVSIVVGTVYDKETYTLYNQVGTLEVKDGKLTVTGVRLQTVTTAVEETVSKESSSGE